MRIKGFDISRAQENIDFDKIEKSGAKFVIIRAGIRTDEDTYFRRYLNECTNRKYLTVCFGISKQLRTKRLTKNLPLV